jgi:CHAT domain-containing protein
LDTALQNIEVNEEEHHHDEEEHHHDEENESRRNVEEHRSPFDLRGQPTEASDESSMTSALEVLYRELMGKVSIEEDEIVIIPDGPLFSVPYSVLRDPDTGRYLSETKRIRIAPSITTLKILHECPVGHHCMKGGLIIGDPFVGEVMYLGERKLFPPLIFAAAEARVIASILGLQPMIGRQATKSAVIEALKQEIAIIHIAAHGSLENATIALSPSSETKDKAIPDEEDYMLTMADVQKAQVRAQLVVLSCCHSGRGEIRAEGVVGMCRAFLASGARAVVGSLWAISDDATLEFMARFYSHIKSGKSASTSLQQSIKATLMSQEYSEPKYWAPFFLIGDDVTIHI